MSFNFNFGIRFPPRCCMGCVMLGFCVRNMGCCDSCDSGRLTHCSASGLRWGNFSSQPPLLLWPPPQEDLTHKDNCPSYDFPPPTTRSFLPPLPSMTSSLRRSSPKDITAPQTTFPNANKPNRSKSINTISLHGFWHLSRALYSTLIINKQGFLTVPPPKPKG